ncbi:MAG TPA: hypothetical protein VGJ20_10760 [Xanthobacteraceae bacterium]|jgi:hypothetical protein
MRIRAFLLAAALLLPMAAQAEVLECHGSVRDQMNKIDVVPHERLGLDLEGKMVTFRDVTVPIIHVVVGPDDGWRDTSLGSDKSAVVYLRNTIIIIRGADRTDVGHFRVWSFYCAK